MCRHPWLESNEDVENCIHDVEYYMNDFGWQEHGTHTVMVTDEDILVNVDSDNLIGKGFPEDVVTRNKIIKYTQSIMPMALDRVWLHCQGAAV